MPVFVCMYVYQHACISFCMFVCLFVRLLVDLYVFFHACLYVCLTVLLRLTCLHKHESYQQNTHMHECMNVWMSESMFFLMHACMFVWLCVVVCLSTWMCACARECAHVCGHGVCIWNTHRCTHNHTQMYGWFTICKKLHNCFKDKKDLKGNE